MKWWGWGDPEKAFDPADKPYLWPFIETTLGISSRAQTPPVRLDDIDIPPSRLHETAFKHLRSELGDERVSSDDFDRLLHAYGKSFRDVWRLRHGIVDVAPDCVVYPETERDVVAVVTASLEHEFVVIPFGGGSNIAGCVEARDTERPIVSVDMKRLKRLLQVDEESMIARVETGVMGPDLEAQLAPHRVTLGHFPDSFEYSTLGGWIATRSAGMQSDKYGKIEDMVIALRMVTPQGTIATREVPKCSNGIDVNHLCIGSEGILGILSEATMQVHRLPERREAYGYLFPDFESGVRAIRRCVEDDCMPVVTRLNDIGKTALSFAFKSPSTGFKTVASKAVKSYLSKVRGFDLQACCLMVTILEGSERDFRRQRRRVERIYRASGGVCLGTEPGRSFERAKYDFPYLRDHVMDHNIIADVSETCTVWSNLLPLYEGVRKAIDSAIRDTGRQPFLGCHVSHTYHTGASLYFTFACEGVPERELEQYLYIKKAAQDAFIAAGGTLSHHHAVGYEHMPWIEEDISPAGVAAVRALKRGLDPRGLMNPGKILPGDAARRFDDWGFGAQSQARFDEQREA